MGFTTGLLGGITLTSTLLYLTLNIHTRNRIHQSALLHQQGLLLTNIIEPPPPSPPPVDRVTKAGVWETAKDRWNSELESGVRKLQRTDWSAVGAQMEEGVSRVWRRAFAGAREGVEIADGKVREGAEVAREKIEEGADKGVRKAAGAVGR